MLSVTVTGSGFDIGIAPELAASHLCHYGCQADPQVGIVRSFGLTVTLIDIVGGVALGITYLIAADVRAEKQ
jgi:hypothetical protein